MSKRLQVLIQPGEYKTFQQMARQAGISLGEWVRRALREALQERSQKTPQQKLKNIRKAAQYNLPTADIEQMLAEIESGYLSK